MSYDLNLKIVRKIQENMCFILYGLHLFFRTFQNPFFLKLFSALKPLCHVGALNFDRRTFINGLELH